MTVVRSVKAYRANCQNAVIREDHDSLVSQSQLSTTNAVFF